MLSQHSDLTSFGISANQAEAKRRFSPDVGLHVRRPVLPEQAPLDAGAANHRDLVQRHDDVLACDHQNGLFCNLDHQINILLWSRKSTSSHHAEEPWGWSDKCLSSKNYGFHFHKPNEEDLNPTCWNRTRRKGLNPTYVYFRVGHLN